MEMLCSSFAVKVYLYLNLQFEAQRKCRYSEKRKSCEFKNRARDIRECIQFLCIAEVIVLLTSEEILSGGEFARKRLHHLVQEISEETEAVSSLKFAPCNRTSLTSY